MSNHKIRPRLSLGLFFVFLIVTAAQRFLPAGSTHAQSASNSVEAAGGDLDPTFNASVMGAGEVAAVALQPDGKIVIGGDFTSVNGTARNRIARLNADGSLDSSFNPVLGVFSRVDAIAVQPDGKIVIGGVFSGINGTGRDCNARINADGSLDSSFNPVLGVFSRVDAIAVQPDGKIVIGGVFSSINGTARDDIARINADGSIDSSFDPGLGQIGHVTTIALQPDGKIVIGVV